MEWQKQLNDFMIIDGLENANSSILAKGALLMEKQKSGELSRMFGYAGKFHALTVVGCVLRDQYHFIYAAFCLYLACYP